MQNNQNNGNDEYLRRLGDRLRRRRLNQNLTQAELAAQAGVAPRTVRAIEGGASASMDTWLSLLRALGALDQVEQFLPEPPLSPIELAKLKGKTRQRATGSRGSERDQAAAEDPAPGWTWGD